MITANNLPKAYAPYKAIELCSNMIMGGGLLFDTSSGVPLLIGKGPIPRVWLNAVSAPESKKLIPVVVNSRPAHPAVKVQRGPASVKVVIGGVTVLEVESPTEHDAMITALDLRPVGLNIFGNSEGLDLGGTHLSRNTFSNVGVAFWLG